MAVPLTLFDPIDRTDSSYKGRTEQDFTFLNRSADPRFRAICAGLEAWFATFPDEKKPDVRGRFREDNGPHSGALLELITHEFLNAIGTNVKVEPDLNGLTPDFEATVDGTGVLFECTVVHPPDARVGADKREATIKKAIDPLDTGRFTLGTRFVRHGPGQPSGKQFRRKIKEWLVTLDPEEPKIHERQFSIEGWQVNVTPYPFKPGIYKQEADRSIGVEIDAGMVTGGRQIQDALEKKAEKYKASQLPYIIVVSHRLGLISVELHDILKNSLVDALFGDIKWGIPADWDFSKATIQVYRSFDGLFGSPSKPENRGVSAVLMKRELTVTKPSVPGYSPDQLPPWTLYHHPEAERPLSSNLFPFAADVDVTKTPEIVTPTCTLKELLNLPDIGKEKYQLKGGMWEAIVG